ncbi:MAG: DNA alkylation repair protein [Bacteroides sp.]|nr:DNA alkylation repair protein [Bacteroides sp.]MCM1413460.1 DNA alkylation repair protein [Bacteroides sp.]MCM1471329.1 DNA alkylation repair protein [Bacteroides sp.]
MTEFNQLQSIKRRFFAMRNGVIADTMRRNGSPFRIIFGLVLPQIQEIADATGYDRDLADKLWSNTSTRESMLLAPMLIDPCSFTPMDAREWIEQSPCAEVVDILVHRLIRKMPTAYDLAMSLVDSNSDLTRYAALRILWHHITAHPTEILFIAEKELSREASLTKMPARQIMDEIEFLNE